MKRQLTLAQYRTIDLISLLLIQTFCQVLMYYAITFWFPEQLYVASPLAGVTALVMMRWGPWAAIHAGLGGVTHALLSGGSWEHLLIYGAGSLLSLVALGMLRGFGKERVAKSGFLSLAFGILTQVLMQLGRVLVALLLGGEPRACLGFVTTDGLSVLLTGLILWIVRRSDGLFEDQIRYLLRMERERQAERRDGF